jgi:hypothetical protein
MKSPCSSLEEKLESYQELDKESWLLTGRKDEELAVAG